MAYEQKEGDFSLFKNDKKTEDKHPDYTGKCMINGKEMRVAGWIKSGDKGKFISGKISELQPTQAQPAPAQPEPPQDDLPF